MPSRKFLHESADFEGLITILRQQNGIQSQLIEKGYRFEILSKVAVSSTRDSRMERSHKVLPHTT
jgi:hypothetical protein